jgi:endonuclease/exonuclease/phosphatase family metal-dependent hydrolase
LRKILYKILLAVNIIIAFSLLVSYLSPIISPVSFALPAFFGLAYPYLLLVNIIIVIIWAMLLRLEAFISVVIIAIGFTHFSNYIKLSKPSGSKANAVKVLSYNVRLFNYFENSHGAMSEKKIIQFLKSQKPDIICLQEYFLLGNPKVEEVLFEAALGGQYYSHLKIIGIGKNKSYGIITLSKFPILRKGEIIHPGSSSLSIYTDVLIQNDTFRIYNNHLQSFRLMRMDHSFINEITTADDKEAISEVKSLSVSLKKGFIKRAVQAEVVKGQINKSPYPVIVVGDFNDTPVSYVYSKIRKGLNDSFVNSGYGAGFTYKGNYPPNRIDYILYDNSLINSYFEIIKVKYSDHYPIISYFHKKN